LAASIFSSSVPAAGRWTPFWRDSGAAIEVMQNSVITECEFSEPSDELTGDFGNCLEANLRSSERESSDPIQHKYNSNAKICSKRNLCPVGKSQPECLLVLASPA
jgi:hypothetical protein